MELQNSLPCPTTDHIQNLCCVTCIQSTIQNVLTTKLIIYYNLVTYRSNTRFQGVGEMQDARIFRRITVRWKTNVNSETSHGFSGPHTFGGSSGKRKIIFKCSFTEEVLESTELSKRLTPEVLLLNTFHSVHIDKLRN